MPVYKLNIRLTSDFTNTFKEQSKLLDNSIRPSLENLTPVISSEWAFATYISGLLPHPGLRFHIFKKDVHMGKDELRQTKTDN